MTTDYAKVNPRIRPLALGVVRNGQGKVLVHRGFDAKKGESFFRPLGGGIEFGETAIAALEREFLEELSQELSDIRQIAFFENIFTFDGKLGHELVFIFEARFKDPDAGAQDSFEIIEGGKSIGKATWIGPDDLGPGKPAIYPAGLSEILF